MSVLTASELDQALGTRGGWAGDTTRIEKTYTFPTFHRAVAFVVQAGMIAEVADHHPDMLVRYSRVTVQLSTHSSGGVTGKDIALADALDLAAEGNA